MEVEKSTVLSKHEKKQKTKQLGGIKTMPFILANEMCDKIANAGSHANMITYLTQQLNMPLVEASNTIANFNGTQSFTPLLGAILADSWIGQFWSIIAGSIFYELGLITITISAVVPALRPPPCLTQVSCKEASSLQLCILYISLLLTAIGSGGIRPCIMTFAANQIDMTKTRVEARKWNFFNWYYLSLGVASLIALTVIVYIQDNVGWGWGLGIPTIMMALSISAFVLGSPLYKKMKPAGSPFIRLVQVVVAATRKRKALMPVNVSLLYTNKELDAPFAAEGMLLHTEKFKWLDKAAIMTDREAEDMNPPNLWRIATVHRVEELKSIIRILPIAASGILLIASTSHQTSFAIQQARTMDRHLSNSFQIPPASLTIISNLSMITMLVIYERVLVPFTRRFTKNPSGITHLQRTGIGFSVNILSTIVAALVEIRRKSVAAKHGLLDKPNEIIPISAFWLVPQFCIHGVAEVFMNVGRLEFLYDQSPESMRSTGGALYYIAISIGNYLGSFLVTLAHKYSNKERNWVPSRNLNRGRLECFYLLASGIQVVNLIYYVICASLYTYKPLEQVKDSDKEENMGGRDSIGVRDAKLHGDGHREMTMA